MTLTVLWYWCWVLLTIGILTSFKRTVLRKIWIIYTRAFFDPWLYCLNCFQDDDFNQLVFFYNLGKLLVFDILTDKIDCLNNLLNLKIFIYYFCLDFFQIKQWIVGFHEFFPFLFMNLLNLTFSHLSIEIFSHFFNGGIIWSVIHDGLF